MSFSQLDADDRVARELLVQVRPAFVAHLEHAKRIQATLAGKS